MQYSTEGNGWSFCSSRTRILAFYQLWKSLWMLVKKWKFASIQKWACERSYSGIMYNSRQGNTTPCPSAHDGKTRVVCPHDAILFWHKKEEILIPQHGWTSKMSLQVQRADTEGLCWTGPPLSRAQQAEPRSGSVIRGRELGSRLRSTVSFWREGMSGIR